MSATKLYRTVDRARNSLDTKFVPLVDAMRTAREQAKPCDSAFVFDGHAAVMAFTLGNSDSPRGFCVMSTGALMRMEGEIAALAAELGESAFRLGRKGTHTVLKP